MCICNSLKKRLFLFWFCLFGWLLRCKRSTLTASCMPTWPVCSILPSWSQSPHYLPVWVPIRLTAGWRQGWFLSGSLLYPWYIATVTFRVTNCPVCLGFLGFSTKSPKPRAFLSPNPSWSLDAHQHLNEWVLLSGRGWSHVRERALSACSKWVSISSPPCGEGWESPDCVFSISVNFSQCHRNLFQVELRAMLHNTGSNSKSFCRVNSHFVSSRLCEVGQTTCSLYHHSPWSSLVKWGW